MTDALFGVPADKIESLVRKMKKASDSYAKMDVFDEYGVDWGDRGAMLWALVTGRHYDAWNDPAIWHELNKQAELAEPRDLVEFLASVEAFDEQLAESTESEAPDDAESFDDEYYDDGYYDDGYYEESAYVSPRLVSFWPVELDHMAMRAYAADPELVERHAGDMIPDIQKGLELVRRRFATNGAVDLPDGTVAELANTSVWSSLPWSIYDVVDGELVKAQIGQQDEEGEAARARFLRKFATEEEWGKAVLEAVFKEDYGPSFRGTLPAWPHASLDQLATMVSRISIFGDDRLTAYATIRGRDDSPADIVEAAQALAEDGHGEHRTELLAIAATLRARDLEQSPPAGALDLIGFAALDSAGNRGDYKGLGPMLEALEHHDEDAVVRRFREVFSSEYGQLRPFPALHAYAHRRDLLDAAFEALETTLEQRDLNIYNLNSVAHGLAFFGAVELGELAERHQAAGSQKVKQVIQRGIIGAIADAETPTPADYDSYVTITELGGPSEDHGVGHYLLPDYLAALDTIGRDRAAAVVSRDLDNDCWIRVTPAIHAVDVPALHDKYFGKVASLGLPATNGYDFAGPFHDHEFREAVAPFVGPALAASDNPDFHNLIQQRFGEERYNELLEAAGGSSAADSGPADRLRRLSEALFESRSGLERTVVYIFERLDGPPEDGSMNRIGGRPFGLDSWPLRNDDTDEPMTHMFTLDLSTVPALKARYKDDVCAVSLFLRSPQHNSAWNPGNNETLVRHVMADNLQPFDGEIPAGDAEPVGFDVHEVEVPLEAWTVEYGTDPELEQIRSEVYKQRAWVGGGGPIWLQSAEHFGLPIMQFDEGFIYTNLGDCGVMYVFDDTAFWQCH